MEVSSLIKSTNAYKIFKGDKINGTLSHAYLISCDDEVMLESYLSFFAKALACGEEDPCGVCRTCKLIDSKTHTDVIWYPKDTAKIVVSDIDELVEKSYLKPLELPIKAFCLTNASKMTVQAQNKLLKTLEEPPENTFILIGTSSVYPLLSTVLSRVKRLDIPPFVDSEIKAFLQPLGYDIDKLNDIIPLCSGRVGEVIKRYESNEGSVAVSLAKAVLTELKSSRQIAEFSAKITKDILKDFISALANLVRVAISFSVDKNRVEAFSELALSVLDSTSVGALIFISDKIRDAEKQVYFNGNHQAVVDGLLFGILEGKFKWSK